MRTSARRREKTVNSPEFALKAREKAAEKWNALTPRDQKLLVGFIACIIIAIIGGIFWFSGKNTAKLAAESEQYRKSLNYLAENQLQYQKNKAEEEENRKKFRSSDGKISGKLTTMASELGIDVNVSPKEPRKVGDDSGIEETEIEIQIKTVDYAKLLEYLVQIHKIDTIYMRHINLGRTSNNSSSETKMTASITLMSYRLKEAKDNDK